METQYKYIHFTLIKRYAKTSAWSVRNNGSEDELGIIKWQSAWRQYCFFTLGVDAMYSAGCLEDIIHFMKRLRQRELDEQNIPNATDNGCKT